MRHKRFYTLVGLFVVGAIGLIFAGAVFFYQDYRHSKVETFVMFFDGSLKGLGAGTPVTYRGIKIGEVKLIEITENTEGDKVIIPVYVEFYVEKSLSFTKNPVNLLIQQGFKADISVPNFLTSIADIELIKTKSPPNLRQFWYHGRRVFPTVQSIEKITSVEDSLKSANQMFHDISQFMHSDDVKKAINATRKMADSVDNFTINMNQYAPSVVSTLNQNLKKVGDAAQSTQNLTDYLARYPESLLRGKQ